MILLKWNVLLHSTIVVSILWGFIWAKESALHAVRTGNLRRRCSKLSVVHILPDNIRSSFSIYDRDHFQESITMASPSFWSCFATYSRDAFELSLEMFSISSSSCHSRCCRVFPPDVTDIVLEMLSTSFLISCGRCN